MDSRVKTHKSIAWEAIPCRVSILVLMDSRVKTKEK